MEKGNEIKTIVPALRFSEFITGKHWYISKIKDIYQITRGQVLAVSLIKEIKDDIYIYPVYSSQTKNGGLVGYYKDYLYENAITWTTDGANAGDVNYRDGKFYCTNVCGVLLNQKGFSNKCMAEIINSVTRNYVSYVGNPKLMNGVMGDIIISVPPTIEEQQKIADCLSSLDELIEVTAQKVDALKEHKKGLMQRLFPAEGKNVPDLRFLEFQGAEEWKESSLDEYFDFKQGFQCPVEEQYDKQEHGMVRFIRIIDLTQPSTPYRYINDPGNQYYINKENLFMVRYGDPGLVGIGYEGIIANNLFQLIPKKKINPYFFYFLFSKEKTRIKGLSSSTSLSAINFTSLKAFKIVVSQNTDEQQKIADCFSSIDELIEVISRKVEILKEHKKGLMQQLFPKI